MLGLNLNGGFSAVAPNNTINHFIHFIMFHTPASKYENKQYEANIKYTADRLNNKLKSTT